MEENLKKKGFLFVIIGAVFECAWVYGLKFADSNLTYILTAIAVLVSTYFFLNSFKFLPTSVAYIFYVGLGATFVVITEIFITKEFDILRVCCIIALLIGIYGLQKGGENA
ncbi:MAG: SMR family transporter [Campylobacter sp.]|nr:SMR family transporter [Campylobacter sp.]